MKTIVSCNVRQTTDIQLQKPRTTATFVTFHGLCDEREHLAILLGPWNQSKTPLVRIHSECMTGDVFTSLRCDCGPQLEEALELLAREGGVLLYLRQEGRGIGLYNKLDAYALQDEGHDTFAANRLLEFSDDERSYEPAAQMLECLGIRNIVLHSNNPDKARQLASYGIRVSRRRPTGVFRSTYNHRYLQAKSVFNAQISNTNLKRSGS